MERKPELLEKEIKFEELEEYIKDKDLLSIHKVIVKFEKKAIGI